MDLLPLKQSSNELPAGLFSALAAHSGKDKVVYIVNLQKFLW